MTQLQVTHIVRALDNVYLCSNTEDRLALTYNAWNQFMQAQYADDVTACTNTNILRSDNIDDICHKLMDVGMGFGMRRHSRISRKEAKRHVSQGVESCGM